MWFLKPCRFFEVIVIDDVYGNDFNDGDYLLMVNSSMQNDGDLMMLACMKNVGVNVGEVLLNVCIIESNVHAFINRIFISKDDD